MAKPATAKPSALRTYIEAHDDLPPEYLLGRLVLFTISEERTRRDDLVAWFADLDLDPKLLPMENKAVDAFRKATSDTKVTYELPKGATASLMCRDVTSTDQFVKRQITREIKGERALNYDGGLGAGGAAIDMVFYRALRSDDQGSARLVVTVSNRLSRAEEPHVRQVARDIKTRYDDYLSYMDSMKIRAMVRNYLKRLNAIEIKGGVYFVHANHDAELHRLAELVGRLGGDCMMQMIPFPDVPKQRAFIVRTFEREASQTLTDLTKEIQEVIGKSDAVSQATYTRLLSRYQQVMANAEEHMLTLQISQESTEASAEIAEAALGQLAERMVSS